MLCDEPLTLAECTRALKLLANNKSPGSDGFTTNFYKFFWIDIKEILFDSFEYSLEHNTLSSDQKRGILNLLPKENKDLRYLANWRPISLLQTDYKILTKALALRLQNVLPNIISSDQVGYIKGRYIGENVRTLEDLITYTEKCQIPGYLVLIDFKKAFDSIEWNFLLKTLHKFNFGPQFIKWIKILYYDISSCVGNNGYYSNYFKLSRGIRQGCPISALLFLMVAEIIAIKLRQCNNIKGLTIDGATYKIKMLADDTSLILKDMTSIELAIKEFQTFSKCSGLQLNLEKTEIIPIGTNINKQHMMPLSLSKINIRNGCFKTLGVWFSRNIKEMISLNFEERLEEMRKLLFIWNTRNLSLKGRITVIKSLVLPKITFLFSLIYVPKDILDRIQKLLTDFLWRYKTPKIKKEIIRNCIEDGGLKMADVYKMNTAAKCIWKKRLIQSENVNSKLLFLKMLSINESMLNKKIGLSLVEKCFSPFHQQVLESWDAFYGMEPVSNPEILNEYVLYNKYIKIGKSPISINQFPNKYAHNLKLLDILDNQGNILTMGDLNEKVEANLSQLFYNCLVTALPVIWKKKVKYENINNIDRWSDVALLYINNKLIPIEKISSKLVYTHLIKESTKPPTSLNAWIELYPFLENFNWSPVFRLPYKIMKETYIQSFQYKVLNRILNCNYNLHKWGIKDSPLCIFCKQVDTIQHHLYECEESLKLWNKIIDWIHQKLKIKLQFTVCEILFGLHLTEDPLFEMLNCIIMYVKHYINNKRSKNKSFVFTEMIHIMKEKLEISVKIEEDKGGVQTEKDKRKVAFYQMLLS